MMWHKAVIHILHTCRYISVVVHQPVSDLNIKLKEGDVSKYHFI